MAELQARYLSISLASLVAERSENVQPDGASGQKAVPKESTQEADFDLIIVGSGYGAAIAAEALSRPRPDCSKLRICILERGNEYASGDFPERASDLAGHVRFATPQAAASHGRADGLFDLRTGPDAGVLVANGLGGGSLINAGVLEAPLPEVFARASWPKAISGDPGALIERAEYVRRRLGGKAFAQLPTKAAVLRQLSPSQHRAVTISVAEISGPNSAGVHLQGCLGCGDCFTGCNHRAKDSLDMNLLQQAGARGVRIVNRATVLRIAPLPWDDEDKPCPPDAARWRVLVQHTDAQLRRRQKEPFVLTAHAVILAAGTLGSTEILMRSRSAALPLSLRLGQRFSTNGDLIAALHDVQRQVDAVANETIQTDKRQVGPTITSMIDLRGTQGIVVQDLAVPAALRQLYAETFTLAQTLQRLAERDCSTHTPGMPDPAAIDDDVLARSLVVAVIGHDGAGGELRLPDWPRDTNEEDHRDGVLSVHWPDLKRQAAAAAAQARLDTLRKASGLGGRTLANPLWRPLDASLEAILGEQRGPLVTVHPLGGCAMGDTAAQGVVDHCGRVFNPNPKENEPPLHIGLYVLDGAIVPDSLGINPALTIATLADRAVEHWLKDDARSWTHARHGSPAAKTGCPGLPRPEPEPPQAPPAPVPTLVEVVERLHGYVPLMLDGEREEYVVELTLIFKPAALTDLSAPDAARRRLDLAEGRLLISSNERDPCNPSMDPAEVLFDAPLNGHALLFGHEASDLRPRIWRSGLAWLLNRGMRDAVQAIRCDIPKGPSPTGNPALWRQKLRAWWHGLPAILSQAGAVRTLDYQLTIGNPSSGTLDQDRTQAMVGATIHGLKRFTYACAANPWMQLSTLHLKAFPLLAEGAQASLQFDMAHAAEIGVPLLRITEQRDRPAALFDLAGLMLYVARLSLQVHAFSFRKPDPPNPVQPNRLPGLIHVRGQAIQPELHWLDVWPAGPDRPAVRMRLARYQRQGRNPGHARPVLLLHGYSASGTTFAHDAIPGHLAGELLKRGRDVWVADLRTSAGLDTARRDWKFEDVARWDIPTAVLHLQQTTGAEKVDVVAHCMGAAMFSMALLFKDGTSANTELERVRSTLNERIGRLVLSQIGPLMQLSPANTLRAYVMSWVRYFLPLEDYQFRDEPGTPLTSQLLDRLLATLPYPQGEFRQENPLWPLGAWLPWVGTRHRMDALYARTFSLANMPQSVLDKIDDFFGPLSVETVSQVIHFARQHSVAQVNGFNTYTAPERLKEKFIFPVLCLHGKDNGLADPATLDRLAAGFLGANLKHAHPGAGTGPDRHRAVPAMAKGWIECEKRKGLDSKLLTWCIPGHGHQDSLMGRSAGQVNAVIADFLD